MSGKALVQIIGAPVACADGVKDTWRETADWAAGYLAARFGDAVRVQYYDLFEPGCPTLPDGSQLPLVLLNGRVVTSGGKIRVPVIRAALEALGIHPLISS